MPILCSDFAAKRPERLIIELLRELPEWMPTFQNLCDFDCAFQNQRNKFKQLGLLPEFCRNYYHWRKDVHRWLQNENF